MNNMNGAATKEQILKSIADQVDEVLEDNSKKTKLAEARKAAKTALVAYICELINVDPDHIDDATFNSIDSFFDQFEAGICARGEDDKGKWRLIHDFLVKYNLMRPGEEKLLVFLSFLFASWQHKNSVA